MQYIATLLSLLLVNLRHSRKRAANQFIVPRRLADVCSMCLLALDVISICYLIVALLLPLEIADSCGLLLLLLLFIYINPIA